MSICLHATLFPSETNDIYDLELKDLMKIEVVTATKSKVDQFSSPGIMQVISKEEIQAFGGQNLFEILNRATNIVSTKSLGLDRISSRGDDNNNSYYHLLFLVNGRPFFNNGGNLGVYNLYFTFPVQSIERIEILRGPGSALYGTYAVNGVVNIITKEEDENTVNLEVSRGDFNTEFENVSISVSEGDFKSYTNFSFQNSDQGVYRSWNNSDSTNPFSIRNQSSVNSLFSRNSYKDFAIDFFYGQNEQFTHSILEIVDGVIQNVLSPPTPTVAQVYYDTEIYYANASYNKEFNKYLKLQSNVSVNHEEFIWKQSGINVISTHGHEYFGELNLQGKAIDFSDNITSSYMLGFMLNKSVGDASGANPVPFNRNILSQYGEVNFSYKENDLSIDLRLGGQFNKPDDVDGEFLPRLSLITRYGDFGLKILRSAAFRAPIPFERTFDNFNLDGGNPNLRSETSITNDIQLFYSSENASAALTFYTNEIDDLIILTDSTVPYGDTVKTYLAYRANGGNASLSGVEFETKLRILKDFLITANANYQMNNFENILDEGLESDDYSGIPNLQAKVGLSYFNKYFTSAIFGIFSTEFISGKHNEIYNLPIIRANPDPEPFVDLSANFNVNISEILNLNSDVSLSIYGNNLLNQQVYGNDYIFNFYNSLPMLASRNFWITLRVGV